MALRIPFPNLTGLARAAQEHRLLSLVDRNFAEVEKVYRAEIDALQAQVDALPKGIIAENVGAGIDFATLTQTQGFVVAFPVESGRKYEISCVQRFASSVADDVMWYHYQGRASGGSYSNISLQRFSVPRTLHFSDTAGQPALWEPGFTGLADVRVIASRQVGSGTFNMDTWEMWVKDIGVAP